MIVNRRTGWRKQAYLTCYRELDFLLDVHLPLEMGIYGMRGRSHMETNISYNASSQTTAQVLPPSARLGSIVSLWDTQGRDRQNIGELGKRQKSQHSRTLERYGVLSDKSPDDRRAPYLFGRTLSVGGVDFIQGGATVKNCGKTGKCGDLVGEAWGRYPRFVVWVMRMGNGRDSSNQYESLLFFLLRCDSEQVFLRIISRNLDFLCLFRE